MPEAIRENPIRYVFRSDGRLLWKTNSNAIEAPAVNSKIQLADRLYVVSDIFHSYPPPDQKLKPVSDDKVSEYSWCHVVVFFLRYVKPVPLDFIPLEEKDITN